ncbi:MAG TPA: hypothetical protein DDW99_05305, partial [Ruminococcaceae bacterium]|nr:hypothetical protein [Oscillospiraceae bacterium]
MLPAFLGEHDIRQHRNHQERIAEKLGQGERPGLRRGDVPLPAELKTQQQAEPGQRAGQQIQVEPVETAVQVRVYQFKQL